MPVDEIRDNFISHALNLQGFDAKLQGKMRTMLRALEKNLMRQLEEADVLNTGSPRRIARRNALLQQTQLTIQTAYNKLYRQVESDLLDVAGSESMHAKNITNETFNASVMTTTITPDQAEAIVGRSMIEGEIQKKWWKQQGERTQFNFAREIRQGMLQGEGMEQMARRIAGSATGGFDTITLASGKTRRIARRSGGVINKSIREARTLVRTGVQTVANEALAKTFERNRDVIKGVQALVTFDLRTSDICIARSGGAWDFDGKPLPGSPIQEPFPGIPPWHFNCRTVLTPVFKSFKEMGINVSKKFKKMPRGQRASMDGLVGEDVTYDQWLRGRTEVEQNEVLGKGKAKLWRKGKITSRQLINSSGRSYTLLELDKKAENNRKKLPGEQKVKTVAKKKKRKFRLHLN